MTLKTILLIIFLSNIIGIQNFYANDLIIKEPLSDSGEISNNSNNKSAIMKKSIIGLGIIGGIYCFLSTGDKQKKINQSQLNKDEKSDVVPFDIDWESDTLNAKNNILELEPSCIYRSTNSQKYISCHKKLEKIIKRLSAKGASIMGDFDTSSAVNQLLNRIFYMGDGSQSKIMKDTIKDMTMMGATIGKSIFNPDPSESSAPQQIGKIIGDLIMKNYDEDFMGCLIDQKNSKSFLEEILYHFNPLMFFKFFSFITNNSNKLKLAKIKQNINDVSKKDKYNNDNDDQLALEQQVIKECFIDYGYENAQEVMCILLLSNIVHKGYDNQDMNLFSYLQEIIGEGATGTLSAESCRKLSINTDEEKERLNSNYGMVKPFLNRFGTSIDQFKALLNDATDNIVALINFIQKDMVQ